MIRIGRICDMDEQSGEVWLIVRSPDDIPEGVKHIPLLAPSKKLFQKYREAIHNGTFDKSFFDNVYVPQFLKELSENADALAVLNNLKSDSIKGDYFLCCYCEDEALCHRSIIAGILLGMGAEIETEKEYLKYYRKKHYMKLNPEPFNRIKTGKKTIELRLYDEKRKLVNIGDEIEFTNLGNTKEKITVSVIALHKFKSFKELYEKIPISMHGYDNKVAQKASYKDMLMYYSDDDQKKYGVVGIEIKLLKS